MGSPSVPFLSYRLTKYNAKGLGTGHLSLARQAISLLCRAFRRTPSPIICQYQFNPPNGRRIKPKQNIVTYFEITVLALSFGVLLPSRVPIYISPCCFAKVKNGWKSASLAVGRLHGFQLTILERRSTSSSTRSDI